MPDVLIGNIRGPQGEAGPANKLLATVYEFCESDSGTRIPAGPWLTDFTEIEKGKYYWCRNTCTWEQGPETILYSVGYVGNDGEFNGIELVDELGRRVTALEDRTVPISKGGTESTTLAGAQAKLGITALEDKIKAINDYTTGINLLKGTRDFRRGTIPVWAARYTADGFGFSDETKITRIKGPDGSTIINVTEQGASTSKITAIDSSVYQGVKPDQEFTAALDVMVDDVSATTSKDFGNVRIANQAGSKVYVTAAFERPANMKSGVWYTIVAHITCPKTLDSVENIAYMIMSLNLVGNGSVNCKNFLIYQGNINHPIWSPSPFDIDYINDETTGINLLRFTRDLPLGSTASKFNGNLFDDGYRKAANPGAQTIYTDSDGFACVKLDGSGGSNVVMYTPVIYGTQQGDYTMAVDYMIANVSNFTGASVSFNGKASLSGASKNITADGHESGKWYTLVFNFSQTSTKADDTYLYGQLTASAGSVITFKRPLVYSGNINNPIWSASPFDVAQSDQIINYEGVASDGINHVPNSANLPYPNTIGREDDKNIEYQNIVLGEGVLSDIPFGSPITVSMILTMNVQCKNIPRPTETNDFCLRIYNTLSNCKYLINGNNAEGHRALLRAGFDKHVGEIYTAPVYIHTILEDGETTNSQFTNTRTNLAFYTLYGSGNTIKVENLKIQIGHCDNPVWTPSPQDFKAMASASVSAPRLELPEIEDQEQ